MSDPKWLRRERQKREEQRRWPQRYVVGINDGAPIHAETQEEFDRRLKRNFDLMKRVWQP